MTMNLGNRKDVQNFARDQIDRLLAQCSHEQRALFVRIFGERVHPDKLGTALELCERTVAKNERTGRLSRES